MAVGGFGLAGIPWILIDALLNQGADDLKIVSNNCGVDGAGWACCWRHAHPPGDPCYLGVNKEFARQYLAGELRWS